MCAKLFDEALLTGLDIPKPLPDPRKSFFQQIDAHHDIIGLPTNIIEPFYRQVGLKVKDENHFHPLYDSITF